MWAKENTDPLDQWYIAKRTMIAPMAMAKYFTLHLLLDRRNAFIGSLSLWSKEELSYVDSEV
jgi:hypothetical protein